MIAAVVIMTVTLLGGVATVGPGAPGPAPGVPGLSPEVAALPASSTALDAALTALDRATATRDRDVADLSSTQADLESATREATATAALLTRRDDQLRKLRGDLDVRRAAIRELATEWFVSGTADEHSFDPTLGARQLEDLRRQAVLGASAADGAARWVRFLVDRGSTLTDEAARLRRSGDRLGGRIDELTARSTKLAAAVEVDQRTVLDATTAATNARFNATIDGTDMSAVALDAYWRAAAVSRFTDPGCAMRWWILAGIGRTESSHGTYLGSSVGVDGQVTPPILGPPLDGTNGFRLVPDSDHGALDGDPLIDRAVGPMQFLPSTWRAVGRDGNGDGRAVPDNIYDAALGAAVYLCRSGSVAEDAGMRRAYLSYNRSQTYVDTVVSYAISYRDTVALPDAPTG